MSWSDRMVSVNVYECYYRAECLYNGIMRHGAKAVLLYESEEGSYSYTAQLIFFPHNDPEDYGVTYDAFFTETLLEGKGRRSKKKEAELLEHLQECCDKLAAQAGGTVFWEEPLTPERRG